MTEVVTETKPVAVGAEGAGAELMSAAEIPVDDQLVGMLVDRARAEGLALTGEGGLLAQLTKRVLESALEGEITDHLGYDRHDAAGRGSGNSRNGHRVKTVTTEIGPVEIAVPRDTTGSFEPRIVKKRQRRLTGVDELVLSLSAKGLTHGEICAHLPRGVRRERVEVHHHHDHRHRGGGHGRVAEPAMRREAVSTRGCESMSWCGRL
jgi:putative transposase